MVVVLMARLEEAGIRACRVTEAAPNGESGLAQRASVWIGDAGDMDRAREILREVEVEPTLVRCPACGYDLSGHAGRTACPECGLDLTAPAPEVACPSCGEPVPANFEVCWSCGREMPPQIRGDG